MVQTRISLSIMDASHLATVSTGPPPALSTGVCDDTSAAAPGPLPPAVGHVGVEQRHGRWLADAPWWEDAACCCEERCGVPPEGRQADAAEPDI